MTQTSRVPITHNWNRNTMQPNHFPSQNLCNRTTRVTELNENQMTVFVEPINRHQKGIILEVKQKSILISSTRGLGTGKGCSNPRSEAAWYLLHWQVWQAATKSVIDFFIPFWTRRASPKRRLSLTRFPGEAKWRESEGKSLENTLSPHASDTVSCRLVDWVSPWSEQGTHPRKPCVQMHHLSGIKVGGEQRWKKPARDKCRNLASNLLGIRVETC